MARQISRVEVGHLFGRYDYTLLPPATPDSKAPSVTLLYGDNGRGKTTILELLFHLLSPSTNRGHRGHVSRTPFRRFHVLFSDRSQVTATRPRGDLTGPFALSITDADGETQTIDVVPEPDTGRVTPTSMARKDLDRLKTALASLDLDVLYLRDDRDLEGDAIPEPDEPHPRTQPRHRPADDRPVRLSAPSNEHLSSTVSDSILRVGDWLKTETMLASSLGETGASQSYAEILRTIALATLSSDSDIPGDIAYLQSALDNLESISEQFSTFGLLPKVDSEPLSATLDLATETTQPAVIQVLRSYLDSQNSRIEALRSFHDLLDRFVSLTNDYLTGKTARIHVYEGFSIRLPDGTKLNPDLLSSGEKHLLLLFLNVLISSDRSPLFIIDEPELSLNIKWQRKLLRSLLELGEGSGCQFWIATHSIELLTRHRECVVDLNAQG